MSCVSLLYIYSCYMHDCMCYKLCAIIVNALHCVCMSDYKCACMHTSISVHVVCLTHSKDLFTNSCWGISSPLHAASKNIHTERQCLYYFSLNNCRCDKRHIPFISDVEFTAFLSSQVPKTQLIIVCVVSSVWVHACMFIIMHACMASVNCRI